MPQRYIIASHGLHTIHIPLDANGFQPYTDRMEAHMSLEIADRRATVDELLTLARQMEESLMEVPLRLDGDRANYGEWTVIRLAIEQLVDMLEEVSS